ncbi:MAG: accessory gene regulator B family protein [Defluviitaleaceae bacterium]|nr:accessory gene regulator B family protein [Defluviitaleaceae bacterium]
MSKNVTHVMAQGLARKINRYARKDDLGLKKMAYSLEIIFLTVSKLVVIYLLAAIFGVVVQTMIIHFAFGLLKHFSFGLHARKSTVCTLVSCVMLVLVPWGLSGVGLGNDIVAVIFFAVIFVLYMYAPADTESRPLIGRNYRKKLKIKAVCAGAVLMLIALFVPNESAKLLLTLGAVFQGVCVLPITYKILRRSERNYEPYELYS